MRSSSQLRDDLRQVVQAVEAVQGLDADSLGDDELHDAFFALDTALTQLQAEHARLAAAVEARGAWRDDGARSCTAWMARRRNGARVASGRALRLGRALRTMPDTDAALSGGTIGIEHATELAACRRFAPDEFADYEPVLVAHAQELAWEDFLRVCAAWRDAIDTTQAERDADRLHERRHLYVHRRNDGALVIQSGLLDPVAAEAFLSELDRLERELFEQDWAEAKATHGDDVAATKLARTAAQRRADALVEMAHRSRTAPADGRRPEPLVTVYVDYQTVAGRLCELASGTPITTKQLLPLFVRADIERAVFGSRNRIIELSERSRLFIGGLRHAIELRDRHCTFPGCTVPAAHCEVDHQVPYSEGGPTTQDNGRLACAHHNRWWHRTRHRPPPPRPPHPTDLDDPDLCRRHTIAHLAALRAAS